MNKNTLTVTHGEDHSIELTVWFTPAKLDTSSWERTPEPTPLKVHSVYNDSGADLTNITDSVITDEDLCYKSSIELPDFNDFKKLL